MTTTDPADFGQVFSCFKRVLVTGPQRSGTQIVARAIAHDTGYTYWGWGDWNVSSRALARFREDKGVVWQHPSMVIHIPVITTPRTAIVYVMRNTDEVNLSRARIEWDFEQDECWRMGCCEPDGDSTRLKHAYWLNYGRKIAHNAFQVNYADMEGHELWVPKAERVGWRTE